MARPRVKPIYDAENIMNELLAVVSEFYVKTGKLKLTAEEFDMSALKIRKLLITAGVYRNDASDEVNRLYAQGKTPEEIAKITGLGKSSVNGYLPYTKAIYKPEEISHNAERIVVFRNRQAAVEELNVDTSSDILWKAVVAFQHYPFHTSTGQPFVYELKKKGDEKYIRELIVKEGQESANVAWSSVKKAFESAFAKHRSVVEGPEVLGNIPGVSYIYPLLYRFGITTVPDSVADKMQLKGGKNNLRDHSQKPKTGI